MVEARPVEIFIGDCREVLKTLADRMVHCCVTSPPYYKQRNYGAEGQIGREKSPEEYIQEIVLVMREVRRILRESGTLWLNLGDSRRKKGLLGIPWRVALALMGDGWTLRQDIIWHKTRPLPDGATDRPSISHEYLFMFSSSDRYYYNADAVMEPASENSHGGRKPNPGRKASATGNHSGSLGLIRGNGLRNRRSVWSIAGTPFPGAHCAPFPPELIEPCIKAACPPDGTILDPFAGAGTTGLVADRLGRRAILIEIAPQYAEISRNRIGLSSIITEAGRRALESRHAD